MRLVPDPPQPAPAPDWAESRYRELFESALVGIYVSLPDGTLVTCNDAFARLIGADSAAQAVGGDMTLLYPSSSARDAFVDQVRHRRRLEAHRAELIRRDGSRLSVLETVVGDFAAAGDLRELRGYVVDVSESVRADAALRQSERQFRAVFYDAGDLMLILDGDRFVIDSNPAASALFGTTPEALVGRRVDDLIAGDPAPLRALWQELLAFGAARREHRFATPAGARVLECSYRAHLQNNRHLCIGRDMTDRRLLQERLMQAQKIESVGRLAGGIAHDFNNLLTAIMGYTELLLTNRPADDPDRADLEEIYRAGQRAAGLTQQLLAFSRKQVLVPRAVNLNEVVDGLKGMLLRVIREDITFAFDASPEPAFVLIDRGQIEQAIINLVLNARDALPAGGLITIDTARVPASALEAQVAPEPAAAEYVRLRVSDTGIGISPELQAHLFEPFFTTKEVGKGTGLGLASVHGIVAQSNGFIHVSSAEGAGTTFSIHFPAVAAPGPAAVDLAPAAVASPGHETILLVEDEDAVRVIISALLRRRGYTVLEASTPAGAIGIFQNAAGTIDLLLTDVVMPDMNGPALAQRLVAWRPELRVLFISGYADLSTSPLDPTNPNVAFLSKPFQASVLTGAVQDILSRPRSGA